MVKNITEDIVVPETPEIHSEQSATFYAPLATYDVPGLARFFNNHFYIEGGLVYLKDAYLNSVLSPYVKSAENSATAASNSAASADKSAMSAAESLTEAKNIFKNVRSINIPKGSGGLSEDYKGTLRYVVDGKAVQTDLTISGPSLVRRKTTNLPYCVYGEENSSPMLYEVDDGVVNKNHNKNVIVKRYNGNILVNGDMSSEYHAVNKGYVDAVKNDLQKEIRNNISSTLDYVVNDSAELIKYTPSNVLDYFVISKIYSNTYVKPYLEDLSDTFSYWLREDEWTGNEYKTVTGTTSYEVSNGLRFHGSTSSAGERVTFEIIPKGSMLSMQSSFDGCFIAYDNVTLNSDTKYLNINVDFVTDSDSGLRLTTTLGSSATVHLFRILKGRIIIGNNVDYIKVTENVRYNLRINLNMSNGYIKVYYDSELPPIEGSAVPTDFTWSEIVNNFTGRIQWRFNSVTHIDLYKIYISTGEQAWNYSNKLHTVHPSGFLAEGQQYKDLTDAIISASGSDLSSIGGTGENSSYLDLLHGKYIIKSKLRQYQEGDAENSNVQTDRHYTMAPLENAIVVDVLDIIKDCHLQHSSRYVQFDFTTCIKSFIQGGATINPVTNDVTKSVIVYQKI